MKKIFLLVCTLFALNAQAAQSSSETMNVRISPIAALLGMVDVNLDFKVHPNWTVGPQIAYWNFSMDSSGGFTSRFDISAFGAGVRGNWFMNGAYTDGLYVGPSLMFSSVKVKTSNSSGDESKSSSAVTLGGLVGYGWFWENFNIMLGGGLAVPLGSTDVKLKHSDGTEESVSYSRTGSLALEFSLGWTF